MKDLQCFDFSVMCEVLNTLYLGVMIIERNNRKILFCNREAANMIGRERREIEGHVCHSFICPSEKGQCPVLDKDAAIDNSERILLTVNGKKEIIKTVHKLLTCDGEYLIESFMDITEMKKVAKITSALGTAVSAAHHMSQPVQVLATLLSCLKDIDFSSQELTEIIHDMEKSLQEIILFLTKLRKVSDYVAEEYITGIEMMDVDASIGSMKAG